MKKENDDRVKDLTFSLQWKSFEINPPPDEGDEDYIFLFEYAGEFIPDIGSHIDGCVFTNGGYCDEFGDPIWWSEIKPPEKNKQEVYDES